MWRSVALGVVLAGVLAGCSLGGAAASRVAVAPFTVHGGSESGPGSGLWGDTSSGPTGDHVGCLPGRHYALAVTLRNHSASTVTITGVRGSEPVPRIIRRVGVQLRLAPQTSASEQFAAGGGLKSWSRSRLVPLAVPPRRSAVVQSNFLMQRCSQLPPHQALTVNRSIVVAYEAGQIAGHQGFADPGGRIILTRGPTIQRCSAPQGANGLVAYDISCGVAERAAVDCHRLAHGTWGYCTAAGYEWDCTFTDASKTRERCWLPSKRQNLAVRWN
jgi:hypothetical protein